MKKFLLVIIFLSSIFSWGQSVIISQYIETDSGTTPKGIEIFNITGSDIVFSGTNNLQVYQGTNGGACAAITSTNITSGTLQAGKVWVIGTANLVSFATINGTSLSGTTAYGFSFNGDDALQVYLGGVLQDTFGTCGTDPGSAWSGSGVSTENNNLQILPAQSCSGNPSGFSDPSIRYSQLVGGGGVMTGFGNAPSPCGSPVPEINVQGNSVSIVDGDTTPTTADHTDFGTVLTSTNITQTFTIQNLGTANLVMPSNPVTLSNTTNGFTVTQPALLTVPAGSSTTFTVTFNSATAGTFTNTINIANNDSDENPYDYAIVANTVAPTPEINIAKDLLSSDIPSGSTASTGYNTIFAALNIGSNSNKTYYIENEGTANLTIGAVTIIGANPGDFSISAIPSTINVGSVLATSIPFTITFTPQASGVRTATISIVNNDSNENPYTFDVQGTGTCPSYTTTLSPSSGPVGTTVYITSTLNLSGTNTVTLNSTTLPVTVISSTQISVVIPSGANTGNIIVTNFQGCSTTNAFTVINTLASGCEGGGAAPTELFISEVTDANTGGLSYIEIYNATGSAKILGTYTLQIYNNGGSTVGNTIALPS
uniref:choice-of-anchor D domain-containing protein n=1 Tax=uncultured Flavobacterium sp. TaxID=165435 RepID=UPI0030ECCAE2